ncbi:cytochrome P450 [Camillea tinctor]|nr:cytochrome P450 [Camillea tinctor]
MDFITCGALTVLELIMLRPIQEISKFSTFSKSVGVFLLQYVAVKFYRIILYPAFFSPLRHLPGPTNNHLFLGQELHRYRAPGPVDLELSWVRRWPDAPFIRVVSLAGQETLLVNSLGAHKACLQTNAYDFVKPPFFAGIAREVAGDGLLFSEGEAHRRQRKLLLGPFSAPGMRKLMPVFQAEARRLSEDVLGGIIGEMPYGSFEAIHVFGEAFIHTVGLTILGIRLETLSSTYPLGFQELYSRILHQGPLGSLISVVNAFVPVRRFLPLEANRRFIRARRDLGTMLRDIIERRARELADGTFRKEIGESRDILTYMLEEAEVQRKETGEEVWTVDDIIGHLLNFVGAGHESTSTVLVWCIYALATQHSIQDTLRREIATLSPDPTHDEISNLPYLHNFLREVLRLFSPSVLISRESTSPLLIEGIRIPSGTRIELRGPAIHHNPRVWGPRADVFDPARWDAKPASPYAFEAFAQGPRICPARHFAQAALKAMLVALVRRWRFVGVEKGKGEGKGELLRDGEEEIGRGVRFANPSLTLRPAGGLRVRFERV